MLKPEQARERLKAFALEDWNERRLTRIESLPEHLRSPARVIAGNGPSAKDRNSLARYNERLTAAKQLQELDSADRQNIFTAIFPSIATEVEHAWTMLLRSP